MWVFLKDGFFSVVAPRGQKSMVVVRARVFKDLARLRRSLKLPPRWEIVVTPKSDYPFRMLLKKKVWADYLRREALGIDYENVKNTIADSPFRHQVYLDVWAKLINLESLPMECPPERRKAIAFDSSL